MLYEDNYSAHLNSYIVKESDKLSVISVDELCSPFSLPAYAVKDNRYIITLNHFIQPVD